MNITVAIETYTKESAQAALDSQIVNRNISMQAVRLYQGDMDAGRWETNGEAIKFDLNGALQDGQHRLRAFIDSSLETLDLLTVRGLPADAQRTMDQGRKRTAGQQIGMRGVKNSNIVAAGARQYLVLKSGLMFRDNKVSQTQITTPTIERWVDENAQRVARLGDYIGHICASDAPPSVAYAAALSFDDVSPELSRRFFQLLAKGAGGSDHPITVLDKRLQRHRREGIKISARDTLALYFQAWNAWVRGRTLTKFQRPRGGQYTDATFPRPVAPLRAVVA